MAKMKVHPLEESPPKDEVLLVDDENSTNGKTKSAESAVKLDTNPNLAIFDEALKVIESTPRKEQELANGDIVSYREYNIGQEHTLIMLPGYACDDSLFSIISVLPEFQDHHIIAVNPLGWNGSSVKMPFPSHEENADYVMELMHLMQVKGKVMVGGYSTGGCIAFFMAKNYPKQISAAFLIHSIPLNGFKVYANDSIVPLSPHDVAELFASSFPDGMDVESFFEAFKSLSSNPAGLPPLRHAISKHLAAAVNMPGKKEAMMKNVEFNVSPLKTPFADPSDALSTLKAKVIVIHGTKDAAVSPKQVELVTKLAVEEHWAPPGSLAFFEHGEGHLLFHDNPKAFGLLYREALENEVLNARQYST